jgi:hypothetical protein
MPPPDAILIEVTHEDIRNGERRDVCRDPVAIAVCRRLGLNLTDEEVSVENYIEVWTGDGWDGYEIPAEVVAWIDAFDAGGTVTPITFIAPYVRFLEK